MTNNHLLEKYLKNVEGKKYIFHYTNKKNIHIIRKYGLLSLYGQYKNTPDLFKQNIKNYKSRIEKYTGKSSFDINDVEKFFESRGLSIKMVFFSFWKIIPGLSKERDEFVNQSHLIKIDVKNLKPTWNYYLVLGPKITHVNIKEVFKYMDMNSTIFQKKKSSRFLFSKIPHLAINTNDGIISKNILIF